MKLKNEPDFFVYLKRMSIFNIELKVLRRFYSLSIRVYLFFYYVAQKKFSVKLKRKKKKTLLTFWDKPHYHKLNHRLHGEQVKRRTEVWIYPDLAGIFAVFFKFFFIIILIQSEYSCIFRTNTCEISDKRILIADNVD